MSVCIFLYIFPFYNSFERLTALLSVYIPEVIYQDRTGKQLNSAIREKNRPTWSPGPELRQDQTDQGGGLQHLHLLSGQAQAEVQPGGGHQAGSSSGWGVGEDQ